MILIVSRMVSRTSKVPLALVLTPFLFLTVWCRFSAVSTWYSLVFSRVAIFYLVQFRSFESSRRFHVEQSCHSHTEAAICPILRRTMKLDHLPGVSCGIEKRRDVVYRVA